ncbi:MAG: hypothetical protein ACRELB_15430 [Polyangiaceae bacterium]
MRNGSRSRILLACALLLGVAAGCTMYAGIVRKDGAPLYSDEQRTTVIARMRRLDDGTIGHGAPDGDVVPFRWRELDGYANRDDLRIFAYPDSDDARWPAVAQNRREVILEGKKWPADVKDAVRQSRVQNGMTREMVELSWGRPTSVDPLPGGGERWTWTRTEYEAHDEFGYAYSPGWSRFDYAYPYGWGYVYEFPYYEPVYYRSYYPRLRHLTVTFDEKGLVTGWDMGT